uniref:RNA helicase n=1 Tax=Pinguiococcus pyrenoidosus TaxID=172671 RepID=A0A7R9UC43_9STRA
MSNAGPETSPTFATSDWGLDPRLLKAVMRLGFVRPTLVQSQCIPLALQGKDLLVRARTGSGKTAAYALPVLHKLLAAAGQRAGPRAVILVPTRELVEQVRRQLEELLYFARGDLGVQGLAGDDTAVQAARLRDQPDVLVATPAKLAQHLESGNVAGGLADVLCFVVDEADLVLSFGYVDDVNRVCASLPKICQGFLMSATLNEELQRLKRVVLHSPVVLKLHEGPQDGRLAQYFVDVLPGDKLLLIYVFLKLGVLTGKGLFFVDNVENCYRLKLFLEAFHIRSAVLNEELPLNSRLHILQDYNRGVFDFLIATDSAVDGDADGGSDSEEDDREEDDVEQDDVEEDDVEEEAGTAGAGGEEDGDEDNDDEGNDDEEGDPEEVEEAEEDEHGNDEAEAEAEDEEDGDAEENEGVSVSDEEEGSENEEVEEDVSESSAKRRRREATKAAARTQDGRTEKKRRRQEDAGVYGVARGVDFREVDFVVNVDMPRSAASYTHRIGRTARGGRSGTALTLACLTDAVDATLLKEIQESQPPLPVAHANQDAPLVNMDLTSSMTEVPEAFQKQPSALPFDVKEIATFRYRVEDVKRSVTAIAIKEARAAELKQEMLNNARLQNYFEENPQDLQLLRHDKTILHPTRVQDHLKHVPDYLIPDGIEVGADPSQRRRKKRKHRSRGGGGGSQDPLMSYNGAGADKSKAAVDDRVFASTKRLGRSTSRRRKWKERHKKGEFATKTAKDEKKSRKKSALGGF